MAHEMVILIITLVVSLTILAYKALCDIKLSRHGSAVPGIRT